MWCGRLAISGVVRGAARSGSPFNGGAAAISLATAAVPELEIYALLLAGLGVVGFIGKRRKAG